MNEDLYLGDIAFRKVFQGRSYAGWHRDTFSYVRKNSAGRMPPLHKVIFYPTLGRASSAQLKFVPGSHHRMFRTQMLDRVQALFFKSKYIHSDDSKAVFFNSALLHGALPVKSPQGTYRLIYNFCYKYQLVQFQGREELHARYQKRLETL